MAIRFTGTDTTGVVVDTNNELWIITEFNLVSADSGVDAFNFGTHTSADLLVEGAIYTTADGVNSDLGSSGLTVTITAGATIYGASDAVELTGDNHVVVNYGSLTGATDAAVQLIGTTDGGSVTNYGELFGPRAVLLEGSDLQLLNFGLIASALTAVAATGGEMRVVNTGTIQGGDVGVSITASSGVGTVRNSGTIAGSTAILGNAEDLTVRNTGDLLGDVSLGGGNDVLRSTRGTVEGDIFGGDGNDLIRSGLNDDEVEGGAGNDALIGGVGDDELFGGDNDDRVSGGTGDDVVLGGSGNDRLFGGEGDDVLQGSLGFDVLKGGGGVDRFVFTTAADSPNATPDTIIDFQRGLDEIGLEAVSAATLLFVGSGAFSGGGAGSVRATAVGNSIVVLVDADGNATADMRITVAGSAPLVADDFGL